MNFVMSSPVRNTRKQHLLTLLAVVAGSLMIVSNSLYLVQCNTLSATLSSLANQQAHRQQNQQQYNGASNNLPQATAHFQDEQQLIRKFMPELIAQAQTDRSLERALISMLMAQRLYNNDDTIAGIGTQQSLTNGPIFQDGRGGLVLATGNGNFQGLDPAAANALQTSGFDPGKRSYWKQCAVNAVSCFGRRKRR